MVVWYGGLLILYQLERERRNIISKNSIKHYLLCKMNFHSIRKQVLKSNFLIYLKLVGLIIFPILLYLIPLNWLNGQHSICLIKNIFGIECFGCGITRAIISAVQLDFKSAYNYNHLVVIVLPIFIYVWTKIVLQTIKQIRKEWYYTMACNTVERCHF